MPTKNQIGDPAMLDALDAAQNQTQNPAAAAAPVAGGDDADEYAQRLNSTASQLDGQVQTLQQSMAYGTKQNPDQYAKLLQLQQRTGVTPLMSKDRQQQLEQKAAYGAVDYPGMVQTQPRTAMWLSNPDNAAVAHDDLDNLSQIERSSATMQAWTPSLWDKTKQGAADVTQTLTGSTPAQLKSKLFEYPLTRSAIDTVGGAAGMVGDVGSFFGWHGNGPDKQNLLQRVETGLSPEANLDPDAVAAKSNQLDALVKNVAPMIPVVMATGGTGLLARTLGMSEPAANVLAGLGVGGMFSAQQAGQTYTSVAGGGGSDEDARTAANRTAAITAPFNALFGATDLVPLLRENPLLTSLGLGGVTGASSRAAANVVAGKPWYQGAVQSAIQAAAMQGGMHLGMGAGMEGFGGVTPEGYSGSLADAVDAAEKSKLRQRSPEQFASAAQTIFDGAPSLQIPVERFDEYFRSKGANPQDVAAQLGSTNYAEAQLSGGNVEVAPADFLSALDPEHQKALLPDVVSPATGMSGRQADEARQELEAFASNGGAETLMQQMAAADQETQASPAWKEVKEDLKQRYVAAGESETYAESKSTLDANVFSNLARESGMTPQEVLALTNPKIVAGEAPGAETRYQSAPLEPEEPIGGIEGRASSLLTPSGSTPTRYKLVEAGDLVPSHNPVTFAKNEKYPEGVQERAYDTSKEAQARVIQQAQSYEPAYTINSNPDAVNGPPVITPGGIVLGGNSRTMSTARLYSEGRGDLYRNALKEQAPLYGFTPEQVSGMREPVLVREVASPESQEGMRRLGTELNRSMTGALGAAEKAVSAGKNISVETLRSISDTLNADDLTLREAMARHGAEILRMMVTDGAISERERPQYVDAATGGLNEAGKSFVEKAILGSVLDDPRVMESAPKSVVAKLERSLGAIASFAHRADEWNILPAIRGAVEDLGAIQRAGSSVELWTKQADLFGAERNPVVDALIEALDGKPTKVKEAFDTFSRDADQNQPGQARMFGEANAFDAFNHAFGTKLTEQEYHDGITAAAGREPRPSESDAGSDENLPGRLSGDAGGAGESTAETAGSTDAGRERQVAEEPPLENVARVPGMGVRGWMRRMPDGSFEIGKTKIGNLSTFVHETGHLYLDAIRELVKRPGASAQLKADHAKILDFLGAKDGEELTTEQHEKWARANEKYVTEGIAPSPGLRGVFQRFAVWMKTVYGRGRDLGVDIDPETRGVLDRLYAAEDGVNRAEQESGPRLVTNPDEVGWTEEEYRNYAEAKDLEPEQAKVQVLRELNEAAVRERTQHWREEKSNVRDAVGEALDARPEYAAIRSLRRGTMDDGTPIALNRDELVKQFGAERVKALRDAHAGIYRVEGGTDAETAAELLGFRSGDEMLRRLTETPRRPAAIEQAVRSTMTEKYGDIRYDGTLDDKARLAVEGQERAKNLHTELAALKRKVAGLQKRAADAKAAMRAIALAPLESYQEAAHQMIEQKALADMQPYRYLVASRKFSREAFDALRTGNVERAVDAKHKELLNHFLFREASAAQDYAGKFESYLKRVQSKGIQQRMGLADLNAQQAGGTGDYRDQFNWLLARYKAGPQAQMPDRPLRAWADEVYGAGNEPAIAPGILDSNKFADYRSVPLSEVRDLHDALVNIRHLALQEFKMFVQGKQVEFAEAKRTMIESARENLKSKPEVVFDENLSRTDKLTRAVQYVDARLMRMERLIEWLDGGKTGPWHDNLWNLASDAQGDEYGLQEDVTGKVVDALKDMPDEMRRRLWTEKTTVDGITEPVTRRQMLSMALNMGNEGNLDRLRKSFIYHGWDPGAVEKVAGMLTREEWGFVQKAWESLKPLGVRMQDLEKRLTGLPPKMVEVKPFKVAFNDGAEDLELAGGYFPIVMDPRYSQRAIEQDSKQSAQNAMQSGYVRATTAKGYTKERTGFGGPLLLDYERALTSHVAKVTKDLSHREFMLASQRLLLDTEVRRTLRETLGPAYEEQFMPWLRTIINDNNGSSQEGLDGIKDGMQKLRGNVVAASLGFNASTSLLQVSHAPRMVLYAKPASLAQSLVELLAHPMEMARQVRELSPNEMRFRGDNLDRDIRAVLQTPDYRAGYTRKVAVAARYALEVMDHLLSHTLWRAAFNDSMGKYADLTPAEAQKKAVYEADSAVRLGLGTSAPKDLPAIMRSNEFNKFITTLYGFHNGVYGQLRDIGHQFGQDKNVGKLTGATILTALLPAVLGSWLTGQGPKDEENAGWWAAKKALLFSADTVPLLRSVASFMEGGHDVQFSPIESVMQKGAKAAMEAASDKDDKDWMGIGIDAADSAGTVGGLPGVHQVAKTLRYVNRAREGKIDNPNLWNAVVGGGGKR